MPSESNPYQSPAASVEHAPRPRTRWRIALVTVLILYSCMQLLGCLLIIFQPHRPGGFGGELTSSQLGGVALTSLGDVLWLASAIACWRGRWGMTCLGILLGLAAMVAAYPLIKGT